MIRIRIRRTDERKKNDIKKLHTDKNMHIYMCKQKNEAKEFNCFALNIKFIDEETKE